MPELPDVEGFRRLLQRHVVGKQVTSVQVHDPGVIRGQSAEDFVHQLKGRWFGEPDRRGKWLLAPADELTLLLHFGMTGSLVWDSPDGECLRFDRVVLSIGSGKLVFRDQRKLGGLWLADGEAAVKQVIGQQGVDALGLTLRQVEECLTGRRGALKSVLMDQRVMAGLGNMLSDEVLWRSRIHSTRRFDDLEPSERRELCRNLQRVLRASVKAGEIPRRPSWLASQRSRSEPHCPRCGERLQTSKVAGRTSYGCSSCQPLPP